MSEMYADFDVDVPINHNFHQESNAKVERWEATLSEEYWRYRKRWNEDPENQVVGSFPIHLDIEATNACNLKCTMCPRTEMVKSGTLWNIQMLDFERYKHLIDEGVANGLCSIKYNYLGEPLMHKKIVDMIKYAKQAGVVDVMFNTNATLLDEKMSRKLIESGLDKLFFSFDSAYRDNYNSIRVGSDYDEVVGNIKRFMKIREEMEKLTPFTRVSMVLMKDNEQECEDYKKLFGPIVDAVAFIDYLDRGDLYDPDRMVVPLGSRKAKFCCPQLWQRMIVHPDGVATVCCMDALRSVRMGNVFEQSAKDIWQSDEYQRMRELHANGRFEEIPLCANCTLAKY